jgi:hypothetical protein
MRYYDISITSSSGTVLQHWTTHPNGVQSPPDPGAALVELDLPQAPLHTPGGDSWFRVWGIGLNTAQQAQQLGAFGQGSQNTITIKGGMGKGLPLANPSEAGILVQGTLYQCFANWIGTNMTLDGYVSAGPLDAVQAQQVTPNNPIPAANIVINWPAGQPLSSYVKQTLQTAYPNFTINVSISSSVVSPNAQQAPFASLVQFSTWLQQITQQIVGGSYTGVYIKVTGNTISVYDSMTQASTTKAIQFNDMVGQITWVDLQTVHLPLVMRGDLDIGDMITLPPAQVTTTQNSFAQLRQSSTIQGSFTVNKIRHVGNSRDPSGLAWVTNVFAVGTPTPQPAVPAGTETFSNMQITG